MRRGGREATSIDSTARIRSRSLVTIGSFWAAAAGTKQSAAMIGKHKENVHCCLNRIGNRLRFRMLGAGVQTEATGSDLIMVT